MRFVFNKETLDRIYDLQAVLPRGSIRKSVVPDYSNEEIFKLVRVQKDADETIKACQSLIANAPNIKAEVLY